MLNRRSIAWLLAAAAVSGACSKDSTGTVETQLTLAQAQGVATQLFFEVARGLTRASYSNASASVRTVSSTPGATPISFTFDSPCALGGSIHANGLTTTNLTSPGNGTVTYALTFDPSSCVLPAGSHNLTISGDPSINMSWSTGLAGGKQSGNIDYSISGGMMWDDGSCKLDYHIVYTPAGVGTLTGNVCGHPVSKTF